MYGHLNALLLSIFVHQGCSVTFKMHQIPRPLCTLESSPHCLVGWDLGQGGATGRTFALGTADIRKNVCDTGVTCHMGSHSVTCHSTQVNVPRFNPIQ